MTFGKDSAEQILDGFEEGGAKSFHGSLGNSRAGEAGVGAADLLHHVARVRLRQVENDDVERVDDVQRQPLQRRKKITDAMSANK